VNLPPVTIGLPFFNAESTLLDAVRSVFCQSHSDWELILLDDGSTDRSLEIAKSIADPRVRVYSDGKNKRLAARLNEIANLARYDYIARMDADDMMRRHRIELQLKTLMAQEHIDLVSGGVVSVSDDWSPTGVRQVSPGHQFVGRDLLHARSGIVHAAVLARKEWTLRNRYDETVRVGQDTDLWVRAYAKGDLRACVLSDLLYYYREDGNVTYSKYKEAHRFLRRTLIGNPTGYKNTDRILAYFSSLAKSNIAYWLNCVDAMHLLRHRRNAIPLTKEEHDSFVKEIGEIRGFQIPARDAASLAMAGMDRAHCSE